MPSAAAVGCKSWLSREAGPPPRTSTPAGAPRSQRITVQPVAASGSCAQPILRFSISVMAISFTGLTSPI